MKIKERVLYVKDLLMDSVCSIDWSNKKLIFSISIVAGFIVGNVIRFFIFKKWFKLGIKIEYWWLSSRGCGNIVSWLVYFKGDLLWEVKQL